MVLSAHLLFGAGFCLSSAPALFQHWTCSVFQADGVVESAGVHVQGKSHHTELLIVESSGRVVQLHADGQSDYFRPGQSLRFRYRRCTEDMVSAEFLTRSGEREGGYSSADTSTPYATLGLGLWLMVIGYRRYRRDPHAEVEGHRETGPPLSGVDDESLLHLSRRETDE